MVNIGIVWRLIKAFKIEFFKDMSISLGAVLGNAQKERHDQNTSLRFQFIRNSMKTILLDVWNSKYINMIWASDE
jgi:hypothetical protein